MQQFERTGGPSAWESVPLLRVPEPKASVTAISVQGFGSPQDLSFDIASGTVQWERDIGDIDGDLARELNTLSQVCDDAWTTVQKSDLEIAGSDTITPRGDDPTYRIGDEVVARGEFVIKEYVAVPRLAEGRVVAVEAADGRLTVSFHIASMQATFDVKIPPVLLLEKKKAREKFEAMRKRMSLKGLLPGGFSVKDRILAKSDITSRGKLLVLAGTYGYVIAQQGDQRLRTLFARSASEDKSLLVNVLHHQIRPDPEL